MMEMRLECERCHEPTPQSGAALVCSFECTYCPTCAVALAMICPRCGGELTPRPRRATVVAPPAEPFRVSEPFRPRPTKFREILVVRGWQLKVYQITRGEPFGRVGGWRGGP